jgi:hypothetical protein
MYTGEGCSRQRSGPRSMFYMFATANSGKVYWSAYPADAAPGGQNQTVWREVAAVGDLGAGRLIGAMQIRW